MQQNEDIAWNSWNYLPQPAQLRGSPGSFLCSLFPRGNQKKPKCALNCSIRQCSGTPNLLMFPHHIVNLNQGSFSYRNSTNFHSPIATTSTCHRHTIKLWFYQSICSSQKDSEYLRPGISPNSDFPPSILHSVFEYGKSRFRKLLSSNPTHLQSICLPAHIQSTSVHQV